MRFSTVVALVFGAACTVNAATLPPQDNLGVVLVSEGSVETSSSGSAVALPTINDTDDSMSSTKAEKNVFEKASKKGALKPLNWTSDDPASIARGRAEALTLSPTSQIRGNFFDRYVHVFFENTDFESAAADVNFQWIAKKGITLTNYKGVAHPSQPNYVASVSGSSHNVGTGRKNKLKKYAPTIIDKLDPAGISWGEYQEDMPYSGFQGDYFNPVNKRYDYVRKHNPLISFDSIIENPESLAKIKNFTLFEQDLANNQLPQWMFITPNMTNCGHDSSVRIAGNWLRSFIEPLLTNPNFMNNTVVVLTFDESEKYHKTNLNKVFTVIFGDAVPKNLHGTKDDDNYNHYSNLATVEQNWNLGILGNGRRRGDARSNAFLPFRDPNAVVQPKNGPVPLIYSD